MADQSGTGDLAVIAPGIRERLFEEPWPFNFFQAVRLLERLWPDQRPVGRFGDPSREVARFGSNASLAFPASEIQSLAERGGAPPLMVVNFMGMVGPTGVLPLYYTALVAERIRARDTSLRDFLDIFNHRAISLFFRAWERYRITIPHERGERDHVTHNLLDLIGLGTKGLQSRQAVRDESLVHYSGLVSQRPRCAVALKQLLSDYFEVPVEIVQFVGAWYPLEVETQCQLGEERSVSQQLGVGAVAGDEVWDQQSVVRVRLGPLTLAQYLDFLPNGTAYEPLRALTRFFSGDELDFEAQLVLRREEAPGCELGGSGDTAPQLGWLTWSATALMPRDPDDTILLLHRRE